MKPRDARGFTLIEVMAAVFMLGLFVTAISQLLTQAARNEGHARLQARAAALADAEIAKIEEGVVRGAALPLGSSESGDSPWRVVSEVRAFDVAALAPAAGPEAARAQAASASWLSSPSAREQPPLLEITVRVSWEGAAVDAETGEPFAIRRRTFVLNPSALEQLPKDDGGGEDDGGEGDEE